MHHLKPIMALGGKDWTIATPAQVEESEIDAIRKRLSRRIREPESMSAATSTQQERKKVDLHTLQKKLSKKLKKRLW
uniref:Uncharacterized protein n=1 Tax=Physcomitrium patens TaxID=3218 RepID=A0A2K1JDY9_PHYPA|nr:hypothetical protein PHYPA_020014 [Physcomitrium patens]